eukprot:TRINITY_DN8853_c0_g1_i1.p1 TRINITY_DN8853_c0_g1~~TRINITY_DN8853_c0_g1_i1.p1  ORF type:complete len:320 (-),score=55.91 TRINITY_DN8853_c0_g1_i1:138-1097(-)
MSSSLPPDEELIALELVIYSFTQTFGAMFEIPFFTIEEIDAEIHRTNASKLWIGFHAKLLKQLFNAPVNSSNWLSYYWKSFDYLGHGLEQIQTRQKYEDTPILIRAVVVKSLCDHSFDGELFHSVPKGELDHTSWRIQPMGMDSRKQNYWHFGYCGKPTSRVYREIVYQPKKLGRGQKPIKPPIKVPKGHRILEIAGTTRDELDALANSLSTTKQKNPVAAKLKEIVHGIDQEIQRKINVEKAAKRNGLDVSNIVQTTQRRARKVVNYAELENGDFDESLDVSATPTSVTPDSSQRRSRRSSTNYRGIVDDDDAHFDSA